MTIVVDTSVIVKWLVAEEGHGDALGLLNKGMRLACPDFAFAEVANVLRRKVRLDEISPGQAADSLVRLPRYFDLIVPTTELLSASFSISAKLDHSVYDCIFLALALREVNAIVVTSDNVFLKKCFAAGFSNSIRRLEDKIALTPTKTESSNG